jgi:chemotaxis protein histidine kinase CheA
MSNDNDVQIIAPANTLKAKLGTAACSLDPEAIMRAETAMTKLKVEFSDWIVKDIAHLIEACAAFVAERTTEKAGILFRAAHDLKGQAATFDYPLIARVAGSLAKLIDELPTREAAPQPLVEAHVEAIRVIHRDKIKDASDLTALTLAEELEARVRMTLARASQTK